MLRTNLLRWGGVALAARSNMHAGDCCAEPLPAFFAGGGLMRQPCRHRGSSSSSSSSSSSGGGGDCGDGGGGGGDSGGDGGDGGDSGVGGGSATIPADLASCRTHVDLKRYAKRIGATAAATAGQRPTHIEYQKNGVACLVPTLGSKRPFSAAIREQFIQEFARMGTANAGSYNPDHPANTSAHADPAARPVAKQLLKCRTTAEFYRFAKRNGVSFTQGKSGHVTLEKNGFKYELHGVGSKSELQNSAVKRTIATFQLMGIAHGK